MGWESMSGRVWSWGTEIWKGYNGDCYPGKVFVPAMSLWGSREPSCATRLL